MTCLHQVSYLRLRDELGVCLSYCCLSGTTCVLVVIQYTAVYLVQCVYLSYSKISLHYCHCCVLGTLYHTWQLCMSRFCDHRACISDEYSAWMLSVLEIEENLFKRNTYTRYHICLMRVFILLLSIRYNVCVSHNPVQYHYITATATAVYLTTCILVIVQNCRLGSSVFLRRNYGTGILLWVITLT